MVKAFITHIERVLSQEGKRNSLWTPYFRTLDGRSVKGMPVSMKHIVPTGHIHFDILPGYQRRMYYNNNTRFKDLGINTFIGDHDGRYFVWHAETPHLTEKQRRRILPKSFLTGKQDKITRQGWWNVKAPYAIYEISGLSGRIISCPKQYQEEYVSLDHLLQEKKCAVDIETEDWKKEKLDQRILEMDDSELHKFYQQLEEETGIKEHPERILHWQRKDYLRKIDELVDSLRQEKINAASYITFRDNDTVAHTFDCIKDVEEIEVDVPGRTNEKRKIKLKYVKDTGAVGEELTDLIQKDDPLFVYGTNHVNFDYKKLNILTQGKFRPGVGREPPKYNANIVEGFMQRRIVPGRLDIDTFTYSLQSSWTYRNNLDTVFNYFLNAKEQKTETYDQLIIKTQKARKGDKKAALDILYYAAQDGMKSYLLADHILEEILAHSKQFSAPTSKVCTASKKTLQDDKLQKQSFERKGTYRIFTTMEENEWDDYSIYENFWRVFDRQRGKSFRAKKGQYQAHILFPTIYYETLLPAIERDVKDSLKIIGNTDDVKKKIRMMEYVNAELEWVLLNLQQEYRNSLEESKEKDPEKKARQEKRHRELRDMIFRKTFGIIGRRGELTVDKYSSELQDKIKFFCGILDNLKIINYSPRFIVLEKNLLSSGIVSQLEEQKLAIELGSGKTLSDTKGRFVSIIDGQVISQGIDPEGARYRCGFETELIQGFFKKTLEQDNPCEGLRFIDANIKRFLDKGIPDEMLKITKIARRDWYKFSKKATQRHVREAVDQGILEGEEYSYFRTEQEMLGENGTIKRILQMRFPVNGQSETFKRILQGEATEEDLGELLSKINT